MSNFDKKEAKRKADAIMRDPAMKDFYERAEDQLFKRWKDAAASKEARETVHLQYLGLQAFKDFMHQVIVDGQMAEREDK